MNPQRRAMLGGLGYSIPLALWVIPLLQDAAGWAQAATILQQASATTLLLQGVMIALFVPLFLDQVSRTDALVRTLLRLAVPWPLLALAWLAESAVALPLLLSQLALLGLALLLRGVGSLPRRRPMPGGFTPLLQLAALVLVIHLHSRWLPVWPTG